MTNATDNRATELQGILDEFEHECFMLRVEASETRAKDDVVRESYECIRDEFVGHITAMLRNEINGETSDGYHTFNELYHHRAVLFSVIVRDHQNIAWKARKHHDGTMYDDMFIVGVETPDGQATYHYDLDPYWGMFDCEEREFAPEWDGHTPDEAIERIATLVGRTCHNTWDTELTGRLRFQCSICGAVSLEITPMYCPNCGAKL